MNIITAEQWEKLGLASFENRLVTVIRSEHPEETAPYTDEQIKAAMPAQLARARRYGLKDEQSAAMFVYAAWLFGSDFDERIPSMAQILNEPTLSPPAKADALANFALTVFHALDKVSCMPGAEGAT